MKKLLLSVFMMVAMVATASANDITLTMSELDLPTANVSPITKTVGDITIEAATTSGTKPTYNATGKDLRIYAGGTFTVTNASGNMTKVVINISAQGLKRWSEENSVNVGTLTNDVDAKTITWEGNANEFVITVGEKSTLGTDGASKAGQLAFGSMVITAGAPAAISTPVIEPNGGDVTTPQQVSITCATADAEIFYTIDGADPTASSTKYTAPFEVATTTTVKAIAIKGFDISSIASETYIFPMEIASIKEFNDNAVANKGKLVKFTCPLTVSHKGGSSSTSNPNDVYVYVQNGDDALLIFAKGIATFGAGYKNGDMIPAGAVGMVDIYNGLIQLNSPVVESFGATTEGTPVEPMLCTFDDIKTNNHVSRLVEVKNITVVESNLVSGSSSIPFYNRFIEVVVPTDGQTYDLIGIPNLYNSTSQLYPVKFSTSTGIEDVEAADVVSTEYYSILGQKLNAAEAGLNIVKETLSNGKVVVRKVMVK